MSLPSRREIQGPLEQFMSGLEVMKGFSIISVEENILKILLQWLKHGQFLRNILKTFMTTFSLSVFYLADQAIGKLQLSKD